MSVTNFEEITVDLNESDKIYEPYLFALLRTHVGEEKAIKAPDLVEAINYKIASTYGHESAKFTDVRLRKFVNYYRCNGIMPLCATSKGYFISFENKVLTSQVTSMQERANSMYSAAKGLKKWIK